MEIWGNKFACYIYLLLHPIKYYCHYLSYSWINKGLEDLSNAFLCENLLSTLANKTNFIFVIKPSKCLKRIRGYIDGNNAKMAIEPHFPSKRMHQVFTKQNPNLQMSFAPPSWSSNHVAPASTSSSTQYSDLVSTNINCLKLLFSRRSKIKF